MTGWGEGWQPNADAVGGPPTTPGPASGSPLPVGELLESAIRSARSGGRVLAGGAFAIAVAAESAQVVLQWLLLGRASTPLTDPPGSAPTAGEVSDLAWRFTGAGVIAALTAALIWLAVSGLAAAVLNRKRMGYPIGWASVAPVLRRSAGPLSTTLLIATTAAVALGALVVAPAALFASPAASLAWLLIALSIGGIVVVVLLPRLALVPAAVVLDQTGALDGARTAWRATRGRYWRVVAVLVLNATLTHAVTAVLAAPLAAVAGDPSTGAPVDGSLLILAGLAGAVAVAATAPFTGSLLAVLYDDLRGPAQ